MNSGGCLMSSQELNIELRRVSIELTELNIELRRVSVELRGVEY